MKDNTKLVIGYTGEKFYKLHICGLIRKLPIIPLSPELYIASFVMLGDTELVNICAANLAAKISHCEFDYLVGPEVKVVPLLHALATFLGHKRYIVLRKSVKSYMQGPISLDDEVKSITTSAKQSLVINGLDAERIRGKKTVIVDDVVSTGGTIKSTEKLLSLIGAEIVCRVAILKEGNFYDDRSKLIYLADLPIFVPSKNTRNKK